MNPPPAAVAAIRGEVADWSPADAAIADQLNAPDRPNPAPQATVPVPFTPTGALALVGPANLAKLIGSPATVEFNAAAVAGDVAAAAWLAFALGAGYLTAAEHDAILALAQQTQPDPAWPPQVSWAVATLGRPVDVQDIHASRPGA